MHECDAGHLPNATVKRSCHPRAMVDRDVLTMQ